VKNDLSRLIVKNTINGKIDKTVSVEILKKLLNEDLAEENGNISVIGMALHVPGADDYEEFWDNICSKKEFIIDIPENRKSDMDKILNVNMRAGNDIKYMKSGYLKEIDKFDYEYFNISPREAVLMDPNQRMFLETSFEAMEDAGYGGNQLRGSRTGVFVGAGGIPFYQNYIIKEDPDSATLSYAGNMPALIAGRVSYILDLHGPCMVVDTTCSSSLNALHLACNAIRNKECDMAIVGGIRLDFTPAKNMFDLGINPADDRIKAFDESADGTVWGEGVVALILKPESKAISDGDNIHANIKGTAVNHDGTSMGIMAPNAAAQEQVIIRAWKNAGIDPETVTYIETHGTGTNLGDPIEITGIERAFRKFTKKKQFCGIGSVKPNIGHLVYSAGLTSMVKVVMALKKRRIPPSINFEYPNKKINFEDSPVYFCDRLTDWVYENGSRRGGVSAFGFSGTNVHAVVEEHVNDTPSEDCEKNRIFTLSAGNEQSLIELIGRYKRYFSRNCDDAMEDICFTANAGRRRMKHRIAFVVRSKEELKDKILQLQNSPMTDSASSDSIFYGEHRIISDNRIPVTKCEITQSQKSMKNREMKSLLEKSVSEGGNIIETMKLICRLYVEGADIDWEDYYGGGKRRRVCLPVYPFKRERCWLEIKDESGQKNNGNGCGYNNKTGHPLVDVCLADSFGEKIYSTSLNVGDYWVLNEHQISGYHVFPGTAYLEMAAYAAKDHFNKNGFQLKDVVFLNPMIVDENEDREVHTVLKYENGDINFSIVSRINESGRWMQHAEGVILNLEEIPVKNIDIGAMKSRMNRIENKVADVGGEMKFGDRWHCIDEMYNNVDETLVLLKLRKEFRDDMPVYMLHPALLDVATGISHWTSAKRNYLPLSYANMKVYESLPAEFYSHIKMRKTNDDKDETLSFDIELIDTNGIIIAVIENFIVKNVSEKDLKHYRDRNNLNAFYIKRWAKDPWNGREKKINGETVLVFHDEKGMSDSLSQILRCNGNSVIEVKYDGMFSCIDENRFIMGGNEEGFNKLFGALNGRKITRIIDASSILADRQPDDIEGLRYAQEKGVITLFRMLKSMMKNLKFENIKITVLTDSVNKVVDSDNRLNYFFSPITGLVKSVYQENPLIQMKAIDIDDITSAETVAAEIGIDCEDIQIAFRRNERYIEEIDNMELPSRSDEKLVFKDDGIYVITGGTGGLGLELGKFIAGKGGKRICLLNRTGMPGRELWKDMLLNKSDEMLVRKILAILEMEKLGAIVCCIVADVTDETVMSNVFQSLENEYGRINGIFHCAGKAGKGFVVNKEESEFRSVLAPKLEGTFILNELARNKKPDFLVLFSSGNAVFGYPGQSDYAAANVFMDAFSAGRDEFGYSIMSINWPAWKNLGMTADYGIDESKSILKHVNPSTALEWLEQIMKSDMPNIIPAILNFDLIDKFDEGTKIRLSDKIVKIIDRYKSSIKAASVSIKGRKNAECNEIELVLSSIWGKVLGLTEIDVGQDFYDLGGDSISAAGILKEINRYYPNLIDIGDIFSNSTFEKLSALMTEKAGSSRAKEIDVKSDSVNGVTGQDAETELLPVQRCFFSRNFTEMNNWNERMAICVPGGIDENILKTVLTELVGYHDSLRMVFKNDGGNIRQYCRSIEESEIILKVFGYAAEKDWRTTVRNEIQKIQAGMDLGKGPLIKFALFKTGKGDHFILVCHHLIIDGISASILLEDILTGYRQLAGGGGIQFAKKTAAVNVWSDYINKYAFGNGILEETEYWDNIENAEIRPIPVDCVTENLQLRNNDEILLRLLTKEETKKLNKDICKAYATNCENILITALGMAFEKWRGLYKIRIRLCGNGRDVFSHDHDLSRTVGWLSISYPFIVSDGGSDEPIEEKINKVKNDLSGLPNKGIGYDILRYITFPGKMKEKSYDAEFEIFFNYLGHIGGGETGFAVRSSFDLGSGKSPESEREYKFVIEVFLSDGELAIRLIYNKNEYKKETVSDLLQKYSGSLNEIMAVRKLKIRKEI
jgi:iturin family lipopeptide synthetase A